jgi:hypothetical protein
MYYFILYHQLQNFECDFSSRFFRSAEACAEACAEDAASAAANQPEVASTGSVQTTVDHLAHPEVAGSSFKTIADILGTADLPHTCLLYPEIAAFNQPEVVHPEATGSSFKTLVDVLETDTDSLVDLPRTCLLYPEIATLTLESDGLAETSENEFLSSQANGNETVDCKSYLTNAQARSFEFQNCHFSSELQRNAEKDVQVNPELQRNAEEDLQVNPENRPVGGKEPQVNTELHRNVVEDLQVNPGSQRNSEKDIQVNPEHERVAGKDRQVNPDDESGTWMTESINARPVLEPLPGDNSKENSWDRFY